MKWKIFIIALTIGLLAGCKDAATKASGTTSKNLVAAYVTEGLADISMSSKLWQDAQEIKASLEPQDIAMPKLMQSQIKEIRVKALCDDKKLAFRLEWDDATQDTMQENGLFSDAVAIQLPPSPEAELPDPMMGQSDRPVHIHLWKAAYQRQIELGDWNLRQAHPHASVDHYPFDAASGESKEKMEKQYKIALASGNPISRNRTSSVDDLVANGYGKLAFLPQQNSMGWSQWQQGKWTVIISRPLSQDSSSKGGFKPGQSTFVAVGVWNGAEKQIGSRKMRTVWIPLILKGKAHESQS